MEVISKRTIGKLIVKYCGNEGQKDDETLKVTLRTLLQRTITKLDTETEETWRNAEIVIYDQMGNDFCIRSGKAENKFVVQLDGEDQIDITCTDRENCCFSSWLCASLTGIFSSLTSRRAAIENEKPTVDTGSRSNISEWSRILGRTGQSLDGEKI